MSMCSVFTLLDPLLRRTQQPIRELFELAAPSGVIGAGQPAKLDVHRTGLALLGSDSHPHPAPADGQRHHETAHHRQCEQQHLHLAGIMRHLQIHERGDRVELDHRAVVEPHFLPEFEIGALDLCESLLLDQGVVECEQRLRAPCVQAGVAAVDVDRDGRVLECG